MPKPTLLVTENTYSKVGTLTLTLAPWRLTVNICLLLGAFSIEQHSSWYNFILNALIKSHVFLIGTIKCKHQSPVETEHIFAFFPHHSTWQLCGYKNSSFPESKWKCCSGTFIFTSPSANTEEAGGGTGSRFLLDRQNMYYCSGFVFLF